MYIPILAGLLAGFMQAVSYLIARAALHDSQTTPLRLMVVSHICMGIMSVCALPFVWTAPAQGLGHYLLWIAAVTCLYISAQSCFFWSVQFTPSSRLAPMMGIKILFAALLAYFLRGQDQHLIQWLAVFLCLLAACAVQWSGAAIVRKSLISVIAAVIFFACADVSITFAVDSMNPDAENRGIMAAVVVALSAYSACLIPALCVIPILRQRTSSAEGITPPVWPLKIGLLYAVVWLFAMMCLYIAFAYDLVFGTIMQSMRGPFAVIIGILVAKCGMHHLEAQRSRSDFIKQICSALLMVVAIGLYCLYK